MSIENVSDLTVKAAIKELPGLSDEELDALYDAELDGKGRKSLLDAITSARDDIREAAEPAPAPVAAAPPPPAARLAPNKEIIHRPARPDAAAAAYIVTKGGSS